MSSALHLPRAVRLILEALISFMPTKGEGAVGALDYPAAERRELAARSHEFTCPRCGPVRDLLKARVTQPAARDAATSEATAPAGTTSSDGTAAAPAAAAGARSRTYYANEIAKMHLHVMDAPGAAAPAAAPTGTGEASGTATSTPADGGASARTATVASADEPPRRPSASAAAPPPEARLTAQAPNRADAASIRSQLAPAAPTAPQQQPLHDSTAASAVAAAQPVAATGARRGVADYATSDRASERDRREPDAQPALRQRFAAHQRAAPGPAGPAGPSAGAIVPDAPRAAAPLPPYDRVLSGVSIILMIAIGLILLRKLLRWQGFEL